MADIARTEFSKVRFAIISDLVESKRFAYQLKQLGKAGALPDRDVEHFALNVVGCERGANIGLNRVGDEAEVAAGLAVAIDRQRSIAG
jgi:hypothetical protein